MKRLFVFVLILFGITLCIVFPLFGRKTLLNANHLVAFYQPWASSPELGWGISSIHHKPLGDDDLWIFYPQRVFSKESLTRYHEIPFWNPLSFAGNHHAGLSETAIFYPLNLLFFVLPQITAWTLLELMQPILVGLGMYLFLRTLFQKNVQAVFGSIVFAFSSVVIVRMVEGLSVGHALLWLPYVLWCIESYSQKPSVRYPVFLTVFLVLSLTAGWFQYTFYILALGFTYALYRCRAKRQWHIFIPFFLFPFFSLFHLIPVISTFLESPRGLDTNRIVQYLHLAPFAHLVTLLFPDFWGNPATFNYFGALPYKEALLTVGIIPLVLAMTAFYEWKHNRVVRFFGGLLGISLLLGINNPFSRWFVSLPIPIVSTFIPSRIFTLSVFSLAVLAAFGLEHRKTLVRNAVVIGVIAIIISVYVWIVYLTSHNVGIALLDHLKSRARNTVFPTALIGALIASLVVFQKKQFRNILLGVIFLLTIVQLWYSANKYLAFSDTRYVYPPHPLFTELATRIGYSRFVSLGSAHIATNIPLAFGLPSVEGAGSMYIQRYGELLSYVTDPLHRPNQVLRIESYINPPTRRLLTGGDPVMQRFLEISGVRFLTSLDNDRDALASAASASANYHLVWQQAHWQLWEDAWTQPRTFITGDFAIRKDSGAIFSDMFQPGSPGRHIVVEQDPGFPSDPTATGSAMITAYTPNSITIRATADHAALLYLSDTFSHTFRATVDGKEASIFRANYAFRAVPIPAGTHTVIMYYSTTFVAWGTGISILLWIIGGTACFVIVRSKRIPW